MNEFVEGFQILCLLSLTDAKASSEGSSYIYLLAATYIPTAGSSILNHIMRNSRQITTPIGSWITLYE